MMRRKDLIIRIARTYDKDKSVWDICSASTNIASILSVLLIQEWSDLEVMIPSLLSEMTPEFKGHNLGAIVRMEPILIACELLKAVGDTGGTKDSKVC